MVSILYYVFSNLVPWFNCCLYNAVSQNILLDWSYISTIEFEIINSYLYSFFWDSHLPIFHWIKHWVDFRLNLQNFFINFIKPRFLSFIECFFNIFSFKPPFLRLSEKAIMKLLTISDTLLTIHCFIFETAVPLYFVFLKVQMNLTNICCSASQHEEHE